MATYLSTVPFFRPGIVGLLDRPNPSKDLVAVEDKLRELEGPLTVCLRASCRHWARCTRLDRSPQGDFQCSKSSLCAQTQSKLRIPQATKGSHRQACELCTRACPVTAGVQLQASVGPRSPSILCYSRGRVWVSTESCLQTRLLQRTALCGEAPERVSQSL